MAVHTFGTGPNPGSFVEGEDPSNPGQALRAEEGAVVKVKNAITDEALPDTVALNLGYLDFTLDDVPAVYVSADDGATWFGPLWSQQAQQSAMTAGLNVDLALGQSAAAVTTANEALQLVREGGTGGTVTGMVDWVSQVANKPTIPSAAADVGALPADARGSANGVAPLDAAARVPVGNLPVGSSAAQVASGAHAHVFGFSSLPSLSYARIAVVILETAPGVVPDLPTELRSAGLLRIFQTSTKPPTSAGVSTEDWWVNKAPATS